MAHSNHLRSLISGTTSVSMVICSLSLPSEPVLFFSNSENSFSLTNAHDCWPGQGDFTLAWLLVFTGLVPRVHQMLIDAEQPLNLPMGDGPLVNYFIMAWWSRSTVELRGVRLPAHHSHPDNLVNKVHRWASHSWIQDRKFNERHMDKRKTEEGEGNSWEGQNELQLPIIVTACCWQGSDPCVT